jgi:hypothetical protein
LHDAVPAFLLALLSDDRSNQRDECSITVRGEGKARRLESSQNDIRERCGKGDRFVEC